MKKRRILIFLSVVIVSVVLLLFLSQSSKQKEEKIIRIGALLPLTGSSANVGEYTKSSAILVRDIYREIFNEFGIDLQIIFEDTKGLPSESVTAYKKITLENKDIIILLTQMSSVANAIAPLVDRENKLMVSISATLEPLKVTNNFYINYLDSKTQAQMYLNYLDREDLITVFYINDEYGRSVANEIKAIGEKREINFIPYDMAVDAKNIVNKIRKEDQATILIGYGMKLAELIRNLRIIRFDKPIICSAELLVKDVINSLQGYEDNVFVIDLIPLPEDISYLYQTRYQRNPVIGDILAYNGLSLVFEAYLALLKSGIKLKDIDHEALKNAFSNKDVFSRVPSIKEVNDNRLIYKALIRPLRGAS